MSGRAVVALLALLASQSALAALDKVPFAIGERWLVGRAQPDTGGRASMIPQRAAARAVVLLGGVAAAQAPAPQCTLRWLPVRAAHRGLCAVYPEETIVGYQAAIDAGADFIECDGKLALTARCRRSYHAARRPWQHSLNHANHAQWCPPRTAG